MVRVTAPGMLRRCPKLKEINFYYPYDEDFGLLEHLLSGAPQPETIQVRCTCAGLELFM